MKRGIFIRNTTILFALLVLLTILHLQEGEVSVTFSDAWNSLFSFDASNPFQIVFRELRLPRTSIALLAGAGLSIAGLLMQTFFNNPLAGPSILGISAGSSLFVALAIMTGFTLFSSAFGIISAAVFGAFIYSLFLLIFSRFVRSNVSLLIIGIMLGSFTNALIQVIESMSDVNALKAFTIWGFGSLQQVSFDQLPVIFFCFLGALGLLLFLVKPLNAYVLGEERAAQLGIPVARVKILVISCVAVFTGLITAYCGPIAFIGLAVPNMVKMRYKTSNHWYLISASALFGALLLLVCDILLLKLEAVIALPLNSITSLFGAPVVIWILLKNRLHATN
jgi:iron complex transport system permease protein